MENQFSCDAHHIQDMLQESLSLLNSQTLTLAHLVDAAAHTSFAARVAAYLIQKATCDEHAYTPQQLEQLGKAFMLFNSEWHALDGFDVHGTEIAKCQLSRCEYYESMAKVQFDAQEMLTILQEEAQALHHDISNLLTEFSVVQHLLEGVSIHLQCRHMKIQLEQFRSGATSY